MSKYADILKNASDLLSKAYKFDHKVEVNTKTTDGVTFKASGTLGASGFASELDAKFSKSNLSFDKIRVGTDGVVKGEMTLSGLADGLDVTFQAEEGTSSSTAAGKAVFGLDYTNADFGRIRANVDVVNGPVVNADALFKYEGFLVGGAVQMNTNLSADKKEAKGFDVEDYNVALGYGGDDFSCGVQTSKKLQSLKGGYYQKINGDAKAAATFNYGRGDGSWCVAMGGSYQLSDDTSVQGKVCSGGSVSAAYVQKFNSAVTLTAATQVDATQLGSDNHKFGLKLQFSG